MLNLMFLIFGVCMILEQACAEFRGFFCSFEDILMILKIVKL